MNYLYLTDVSNCKVLTREGIKNWQMLCILHLSRHKKNQARTCFSISLHLPCLFLIIKWSRRD